MNAHDRHPPSKLPMSTEAELREKIAVLRDALQRAPERYVVQHHGYDVWYLGARAEALALTEGE